MSRSPSRRWGLMTTSTRVAVTLTSAPRPQLPRVAALLPPRLHSTSGARARTWWQLCSPAARGGSHRSLVSTELTSAALCCKAARCKGPQADPIAIFCLRSRQSLQLNDCGPLQRVVALCGVSPIITQPQLVVGAECDHSSLQLQIECVISA